MVPSRLGDGMLEGRQHLEGERSSGHRRDHRAPLVLGSHSSRLEKMRIDDALDCVVLS